MGGEGIRRPGFRHMLLSLEVIQEKMQVAPFEGSRRHWRDGPVSVYTHVICPVDVYSCDHNVPLLSFCPSSRFGPADFQIYTHPLVPVSTSGRVTQLWISPKQTVVEG